MWKFQLPAICLRPVQSVAEAIACIDASGGQIALVTDENGILLGTVTDGDVRRGILHGVTVNSPVRDLMNANPRSVHYNTPSAEILARLRSEKILQMPLLDEGGKLVDIVFVEDFATPDPASHPVVIMAGGLGTRLRPITETVPKPMIPVAGKPILETIIERFEQQGFRSITLCVNHLAEVIEAHFGNGSAFGVSITYVKETRRMGTAGALSLLDPRPELPAIIINGDILTATNFRQMLAFHYENRALATMGLNRFQYQLPYGVVDVKAHHITSFREKPVFDFFVNAGIYIVSPDLLDHVPSNQYFDMPSLFEQVSIDRRVAFPIHECWMDIGQPDDLERARREFNENFIQATH